MHILEAAMNLGKSGKQSDEDVEQGVREKLVLIVEDDLTLRPLWERAFKSKGLDIKVDWATSMEEAERLIRHRFKYKAPYQLVVADIFLEGQGSGIDLWNRYGEEAMDFVFVSALPISKYEFLMSLNYGCPLYLKKPLSSKKCEEIADIISSSTD
jgi:DNA-binding response OmpR family regulator